MHFITPTRPRVTRIVAVAVGIAVAVTGCGSGGDAEPGSGSSTAAPTSESAATAADSAEPAEGNECGGMGIDHDAAVTRGSDIVIDAPLQEVWDTHTDVEGWAGWQKAILTIERLDQGAALSATSQFRWTTPVPESQFSPADTLVITSSVRQLEPGACVIWEGPAVGKAISIDRGVHLWTFTEKDGATHVHTEESWAAPFLDSLKGPDYDTVAAMLGGGLDLWLQDLKAEVEASAGAN
jgi:uncharacterized protein YndB with AHSA1/START domain